MQPAPHHPLSISQNALRSRALVDRLLAISSVQADDLVFDLGAGTGIIADRLAVRGCRVAAVEKDADLVARLRARFADVPLVRVCHADILDVVLPRRPYKVFANIPFDATAAIVEHLARAPRPPEDAYLVVQHEAAQRFIGQPREALVAVLLKPWLEPTIVHHFRRTDFLPAPRVEVVLLRLRKRGPPLVPPKHAQFYRDFVVHLFTDRHRSTLESLGRALGARRARRLAARIQLDPGATPSALAFERWLELFNVVASDSASGAGQAVVGAELRLRRHQRRLRKVHRTRTPGQRRPAAEWPRRDRSIPGCRPPPHGVRALRQKHTSTPLRSFALEALPALDEVKVNAELVQSLHHDVVHEILDSLGPMVETGHRREHDRAGLRDVRHQATRSVGLPNRLSTAVLPAHTTVAAPVAHSTPTSPARSPTGVAIEQSPGLHPALLRTATRRASEDRRSGR